MCRETIMTIELLKSDAAAASAGKLRLVSETHCVFAVTFGIPELLRCTVLWAHFLAERRAAAVFCSRRGFTKQNHGLNFDCDHISKIYSNISLALCFPNFDK